jgi:hypothetical protein
MANTAKSVVITGIADMASSTGNYFAGSNAGQFTVDANGDFTLTLNLYDGQNNIGMNDVSWNHYGLNIQTSNGVLAPQFVFIDSPLDLETTVSGDVVVTGHLDPGFTPFDVWANVNIDKNVGDTDPANDSFMFNFYHSNPMGTDMPLTYNSAAGTFSFVIPGITVADRVRIRVESCSGPVCHGQEISINDAFAPSGYHWKGGAGEASRPAVGPAVDQLKNTLKIRSR